MRFYAVPPGMGYYAQSPESYGYYGEEPYLAEELPYGEVDPYGSYAEPPEGYGYYGEEPYLAEELPYGEVDPYGSYAEPPEMYGEIEPGYGQYEPVGYFAEEYPLAAYGEEYPMGYFAEDYPPQLVGQYEPMGYYGQMPEMVGYGQYEPLSEEYPGMAAYGEPDMAGYVRETEPTFNAGCPMPTNVAGFEETGPLEGYVRPTTVNPTCERFTPQPGPPPSAPEAFKPLW